MVGVIGYAFVRAPSSTEPAIANGDTRTLTFTSKHTNETASFTYLVNGAYDQDVLDKLNWFMRDWRLNEQTKMDPRLFDIIWDVYRQSGSTAPIDVLSGYRSPQTNAMLRRRSRLVASHSQHMQGKAIDAHFLDVGTDKIRDVAMRMQEGGVGFYPIGSTPWVHIDSGAVRYWPRMSRAALSRLFPDGKTVFIPADGQPMEGYAEAKAMIEQRGGQIQTASSSSGGLLSWLFGGPRGGGVDDEEETAGATVLAGGRGGPPAMMAGRGGTGPAAIAAAAPPPPQAAPAAPVAPAPTETAVASTKDDETSPPVEAAETPAPMPPIRPVELASNLDAAPMPPRRPSELTIPAAPDAARALPGDRIAAVLAHEGLPGAITRGVHDEPPKDALALAEPSRRDHGDTDALARAAALAPPPLPPRRPRPPAAGQSSAERAAPLPPPRPSRTPRASAANPYGSLIVDAFNTGAPPAGAAPFPDLRGPSP